MENGAIKSPNYPEKYADSSSSGSHQCHWFIHVKPRHKILLYFEEFEVEGKPNGKLVASWISRKKLTQKYFSQIILTFFFYKKRPRLPGRHIEGLAVERERQDAPGAVRGQPGAQLADSVGNQRHEAIVSIDNWPRYKFLFVIVLYFFVACRFLIADKAVGAKGFKAIWTEIKEGSPNCQEFSCYSSSFCISEKLKCNGVNNCGQNDKSDEIDCKKKNFFQILIALVQRFLVTN